MPATHSVFAIVPFPSTFGITLDTTLETLTSAAQAVPRQRHLPKTPAIPSQKTKEFHGEAAKCTTRASKMITKGGPPLLCLHMFADL